MRPNSALLWRRDLTDDAVVNPSNSCTHGEKRFGPASASSQGKPTPLLRNLNPMHQHQFDSSRHQEQGP